MISKLDDAELIERALLLVSEIEEDRAAARVLQVSPKTVKEWREGVRKPMRQPTRLKLIAALANPQRALSKQTWPEADDESAALGETMNGEAEDPTKPPSLAQMEWVPRLLERAMTLPDLSGAERIAAMAEVNAAAMRYWAVAAEWSSGQRGIAMSKAEEASGERASAIREASRPRMPGGRPVTEEELRLLEELRATEQSEAEKRVGGNQK